MAQVNNLKTNNRATACISPINESFSGQSSTYGVPYSRSSSSYGTSVGSHRRTVSAFSSLADLKAQQRELSQARSMNVRIKVKNDAGSECIMTAIPESHKKQPSSSTIPMPTSADMKLLGLSQPHTTHSSSTHHANRRIARPTPSSLNRTVTYPYPYDKRDEDSRLTSDGPESRIFRKTGGLINTTGAEKRTQVSPESNNETQDEHNVNFIREMNTMSSELQPPEIVLSPSSNKVVHDDVSELMHNSESDLSIDAARLKQKDESETTRPRITKMRQSFKKQAKRPLKFAKKMLFRVGKRVKNALCKSKDKFLNKKKDVELERSMGYLL